MYLLIFDFFRVELVKYGWKGSKVDFGNIILVDAQAGLYSWFIFIFILFLKVDNISIKFFGISNSLFSDSVFKLMSIKFFDLLVIFSNQW